MELAEREWSNAEEIKQVKQQHASNLLKMRETCVPGHAPAPQPPPPPRCFLLFERGPTRFDRFEDQLNDLDKRCGERLDQLDSDLELRRKVRRSRRARARNQKTSRRFPLRSHQVHIHEIEERKTCTSTI